MKICGVSFDSNTAIIAIVEFEPSGAYALCETETKRLGIDDHKKDACLTDFARLLGTIASDHEVSKFAVRRCTYSGLYSSSAASIKMEALFQLAEIKTVLLDPKTINKSCDENCVEIPSQINKYQNEAFKAAFAVGMIND